MKMTDDLESVLISQRRIARRTRELGEEITAFYGEGEIAAIAIINGALLFTADLIRRIAIPVRLDCIRVASYHSGIRPAGEPELVYSVDLEIENKRVLLIDDILDTGRTLFTITRMFERHNPRSLHTCVLLNKKGRREIPFEPDFVGFDIPDKFVVGYGLDFAGRYRNLPCIGSLKPELQNPPGWS